MRAGSFFSGGLTVIAARVYALCLKFQVFFDASCRPGITRENCRTVFLLRVVGQVHLRIRVNACSRNHIEGVCACMPEPPNLPIYTSYRPCNVFAKIASPRASRAAFLVLCFSASSRNLLCSSFCFLVLLLSRLVAFSSLCFLV